MDYNVPPNTHKSVYVWTCQTMNEWSSCTVWEQLLSILSGWGFVYRSNCVSVMQS